MNDLNGRDDFNTKIIAMYLPQFHEVPENSKWWGDGFTEWTAVRSARPLFEMHKQPVVPSDGWYYDLSEKQTMQWQAKLLHEYSIDGLCFYHYYFGNGKKLLEKPAENLLGWKDIDMPFCFSWANESWKRTWSNIEGNGWNPRFDSQKDESENGLLIEQVYGEEEEWIEHLEYLLPFFCDERYIKVDGHPVFVIYLPANFDRLEDMMTVWNSYLSHKGLKRPYYIGANCQYTDKERLFDSIMYQEPQNTIGGIDDLERIRIATSPNILDYDKIWRVILGRKYVAKKTCLGAFNSYDDTPRRGKVGTVILGRTPEKYEKFLKLLMHKAITMRCPFIFFNAWNEWGEGMHLEPESEMGTVWLEIVRKIKTEESSITVSEQEIELREIERETQGIYYLQEKKQQRRLEYFEKVKSQMLQIYENNTNIRQKGEVYKKIRYAIYGMGDLGKRLLKKMKLDDLQVLYVIDKNQVADIGVRHFFPDDLLPEVDVVIVTVAIEYRDVMNLLRKKTDAELIRVDEFLQKIIDA